VAAASSEAITTGGSVVPSAFSVLIPTASAQTQTSLPAPTTWAIPPATTVSSVALASSVRVTVAIPVATSTAAAPAPTLGIPGIVIAGDSTLTLSGGTTTMVAAKTVTATAGTLTLDTMSGIVNFGHTVRTTPGEIVLGGTYTRLSKGGDPTREVIARFEDLVTGQELVTIEDEATGEIWTRPSKLMHIYRMGYGDKWRKAKERRFGRSPFPQLRPARRRNVTCTSGSPSGPRPAPSPRRYAGRVRDGPVSKKSQDDQLPLFGEELPSFIVDQHTARAKTWRPEPYARPSRMDAIMPQIEGGRRP
jgi:hypothetical protein